MSVSLTVVILTRDEEKHLPRLLSSLKELEPDIVVVDSGSTDRTEEIARNWGCRFYCHPWENYARQFQWGLDNCEIHSQWVMRMDADEYLEVDLIGELKNELSNAPKDIKGFYIKRKVLFMDKWIRHGGHYPQVLLRVWRNKEARIEQRWMDEHMRFNDEDAQLRALNGHIVDHNLNTVTWWIDKHNKYASREAVDILISRSNHSGLESVNASSGYQAVIKRFLKNNIYNRMPLAMRAVLYFLYRYFIRLGFLDGKVGFFYHFMQGFWYRSLVDLKVCEFDRSNLSKSCYDEDDVRKFFGL